MKIPRRDIEVVRRTVRLLQRFDWDERHRMVRNDRGVFTRQALIRRCPSLSMRAAERVMSGDRVANRIVWMDPREIVSCQRHLRVSSLLWNLRNFERMQQRLPLGGRRTYARVGRAGRNLPKVVWADGRWVLWNGNHRVTISLLLRLPRIRVMQFKRPRAKRCR